jgi:antitoxin PrlF
MTSATVGADGALAIPTDVLEALRVREGDRIEFVLLGEGQCLLIPLNRSVTELRGMFGKPAQPVSIDEMNKALSSRGAGGAPA